MTNIQEYKNKLEQLKRYYEKESAEKEALRVMIECKKAEIATDKTAEEKLMLMHAIITEASSKARENGKRLLQEVATNAVRMAFGDKSSVILDITTKGGIPHANLLLDLGNGYKDSYVEPVDEDGGGLADVVSMTVFVCLRMLSKKHNSAPMFLDEPTKNVSSGKAEGVANFIKEMCSYSDVQTFVVTHEKDYLPNVADQAYRVVLVDGISRVEKI